MATAASLNIVNSYYQGILRFTPPAGLASSIATQLDSGTLTAATLAVNLLTQATSSSIPALLTYDFMFGTTPASSGLTYLTTYATDLQAGNYTFTNGALTLGTTTGQYSSLAFSLINTYVNLGATFATAASSTFAASYGSLTPSAFITTVYTAIFGKAPTSDTVTYLQNSLSFYEGYAGSTIGGYGAIAGLLLYTAETGNSGQYPAAANAFLSASASSLTAGTDTAKYGTELLAGYGSLTGSATVLTTGADNVTANVIVGDLSPFFYNGVGPTLNIGDNLKGQPGSTTNTFVLTDQYGVGNDVIPAGVSLTNVQTIDLNTQGNAGGGAVGALGGAGGITSGVLDLTTTANGTGNSTTGSTISGVTAVNVVSAGSGVDNVRVDPGLVNPVNVAVNHQHVGSALGGVGILGGNNITVNDGDGTIGGLVPPPADGGDAPAVANKGVNIGSATIVNTNSVDLNPTGTVTVNEIGNNQININGGTKVVVNTLGGGYVQVGQPTGAALSYPSDEPVDSVTVTDGANVQAGEIYIYGAAPIVTNGTTTLNTLTASVTETSLLANEITIGNVAAIAGIFQSYSPTGPINVNVAVQTPVAYSYTGGVQSGINPNGDEMGISTIFTNGGSTTNVVTNGNAVYIGSDVLNGLTPVANQNPTGNVAVVDTAVVGTGAFGAAVTVDGGANVAIANAGGAVTIGSALGGPNLTIGPVGTVTVTDKAPLVYDGVINTATLRDIAIVGGTNISAQTNSGAVTIGTAAGIVGSEPTGTIAVVDSASPGVNVFGYEGAGTDVPITIFGGTNVTAVSANGAITIGAGTTTSDPSGAVSTIMSGVETGGQFASTTTINGGTAVTALTTGGSVSVGTAATAVTGSVTVVDTFAGRQNLDTFSVIGGAGTTTSPAVDIATTPTGGSITVGVPAGPGPGGATLDTATGTKLVNASDYANGNVIINNDLLAGTGYASTKNIYGTGATTVNTYGSLANTVAITGGGAASVTDLATTLATGGAGAGKAIGASSLATVALDHVGTGGSISTIKSDALTNLSVIDDTAGDTYNVVETPGFTLNLTVGNDATLGKTTTIADLNGTATTLKVTDNGTASAGTIVLTAAKATSATFTTTAAQSFSLVADPLLSTVALNNAGNINLNSLAGLVGVAVTAGASSKGNVKLTLNPATSTFNGTGSTGNDTITITSNAVPTGAVTGGSGSNTVIASYGAGVHDTPLTSTVRNFGTLGAGAGATSGTTESTVTVTSPAATPVGSVYSITINGKNYTYTQIAGDTAATIAAGLAAAAAASGLILAPVTATPNVFTVVSQAGNPAVIAAGANLTVAALAGGLPIFLNGYDATGFGSLLVGPTAGPIFFDNVASSESLTLSAFQGNAADYVELSSTTVAGAAGPATLTITQGTDGAPATATAPAVGSAGFTSTVLTNATTTLNINSVGEGAAPLLGGAAPSNVMVIEDGVVGVAARTAAQILTIGGDASLTLYLEADNGTGGPAVGGILPPAVDPYNSAVSTINASNVAALSQAGGKPTIDVSHVAVAYTGANIVGGAAYLIANGAGAAVGQSVLTTPGLTATGIASVADISEQQDVITFTVTPVAGDVVSATLTPNSGPGAGVPVSYSYTVAAGDIGASAAATQQNVAAQLAGVINGSTNNTAGLTAAAGTTGAAGTITFTGSFLSPTFVDGGVTDNKATAGTVVTAPFGAAGTVVAYTQAIDKYAAGAGGATFTLGAGGGYNPYKVFTAQQSTTIPGTNANTFLGALDTGSETVNLSGSTGAASTIVVQPNVVSLFNNTAGGVTGFAELASPLADALKFTDSEVGNYTSGAVLPATATPFKVVTNVTGATLTLTKGSPASNTAAALDPSGALGTGLSTVSYSTTNGLIVISGTNNFNYELIAAEIIVAQAAGTAAAKGGTASGAVAAISDGQNLYVISARPGNNFGNLTGTTFQAVPQYTSATTQAVPVNTDLGISIVQLLGDGMSFSGFASSQTSLAPTVPTVGLGATTAVVANVVNNLANKGVGNGGTLGASATYNDTGYSIDKLTVAQVPASASGITTTFSNLAPAAELQVNAGGNTVGNIATTQAGTAGQASLIVDLQAADTVGSLTTSGDWEVELLSEVGGAKIGSFTDATSTVTKFVVTGAGGLSLGPINTGALATVDATTLVGAFTFGSVAAPVNVNGLTVKGSIGGDTIVTNGGTNTITVGSATKAITGAVSITAPGAADVITLTNQFGSAATILASGGGDTISVTNGVNTIIGGGALPVPPAGTALPLGLNDTVNLADGGTDTVWVGGGNSVVNLTGAAASTSQMPTTNFGSTATLILKGDTTGTTSAGFATGGTAGFVKITGADVMTGTLSLNFGNAPTEGLAGGSFANAFINVQGAPSLSAALDQVVAQSLVEDAQIEPGAFTTITAGQIQLDAKTSLLSFFQFGGNTYVVDAVNSTANAAAHSTLATGDSVVQISGVPNILDGQFSINSMAV
jgi:hypothetical protein